MARLRATGAGAGVLVVLALFSVQGAPGPSWGASSSEAIASTERTAPDTPTLPDGLTSRARADAAAPDTQARPDGLTPRSRSDAAAPGEVIVKWEPGVSARQRSRARAEEHLEHAAGLGLIGGEVATFPPERGSPSQVAARLSRHPRVAYAEPNLLVGPHADAPDDARFDQLWGLVNTGQAIEGQSGTPGTDIRALEAWETTRGDDGVTVAVIDTGTDIDHPDLAANAWTNHREVADGTDTDDNGYVDDLHGWDFFNGDTTVFDAGDGDAHGTHVAGTVAAVADNTIGIAGVAPDVEIMPVKFLGPGGDGTFGDAIQAIEYAADNGADIANTSWGGPGFSEALRDAIEASGMLFVAAAGNQGQDNDQTAEYPCSYDLETVLCTTAVDNTGALPDFANTGPTTVEVGAPGVGVLSIVPRGPRAPVGLEVDDPATGHKAMFWGFGLEQAVGAAERAELLDRALGDHLGTGRNEPILLVDDDESDSGRWPDTRPYYVDALKEGGYTDVSVETVPTDQSGPNAADLEGRTVVWFTGLASGHPDGPTTLTSQDRAELVEFLEDGGRLVLAGEDAIFRVENSTLVTDYLHADVVDEVSGRAADGGPDSVYAGRGYDLAGSESPTELPSPFLKHVEPASAAAVEALILPAQPYDEAYEHFDGTSMAAPHASGVAALLVSHQPELEAAQLADRVERGVEPLASLDGVTATGGMVNAARTLAVSVPGAPTEVSAVAGDGQATVSWEAPVDDGGAAISSYTVRSDPEGVEVTVGGGETEAVVTGLTNGVTYEFTVAAANEAGEGPASTPSNPVTPQPAVSVPGAPTEVSAVAGDGQATVSWEAPVDDGGAAISSYTVRSDPEGVEVTVGGGETEAVVTGLTNGVTYEFTVAAANEAGEGPASTPSNPATPTDPEPPEPCDPDRVPPARFVDVAATNPHRAAIDCVVWYAIALGTTDTTYSPRSEVRRDQMASFLARTIDASEADLPDGDDSFTDVAGNPHRDNIERLAEAGIVQGVGDDRYAPAATVTRAQMASFLARAYAFVSEALPVAETAFTDIQGNTHEDNIERVAGAGIARGTTVSTYSPSQAVFRDQMASFLARTLEGLAEDGRFRAQGG